jgi:hypothetical protein
MLFAHRDKKDQTQFYQLMKSFPLNNIIITSNTHMEQSMYINVCTTVKITHVKRTEKARVDMMIMLAIFISLFCQVITYLGSKS